MAMDSARKEFADSRSQSGVYRGVSMHSLMQLRSDLNAASARVVAFRADIQARRSSRPKEADEDLGSRALQEVDVAHEELRVAEEQLQAQADEIVGARASWDRERRIYGELFDGAPEAYLVTDDRGMILQANRLAARLFKLDQALMVGKPLFSLVAHEDRGDLSSVLEAATDSVLRAELRIRPRKESDGEWVALSAQRGARDESSSCVRWVLRSIAHEREEGARREDANALLHARVQQLEAALRAANQATEREHALRELAERRDEDKSVVLAETAHELRNPLGTFAGWLKLLSDGPLNEATVGRAVESMTRAARSMVRIVEDLVDNARVENNQLVLKLSTVNVVRLLIEVVQDTRPLAVLKNIQVALAPDSHRLEVQGDPWRLTQVFKNIIGNAIKFTPERGSIQLRAALVDGYVEVAISDTGRGIPASSLEKIFAPFTQIGAPGARHTGLGLGLSIARRLIELHGGSISASSPGEGGGSTFTVRLPLFALN